MNATQRRSEAFSTLGAEIEDLKQQLSRYQPIRYKDRMPTAKDMPVLLFNKLASHWFPCSNSRTIKEFRFWLPMPPNPE